jgi:hypothetical protein
MPPRHIPAQNVIRAQLQCAWWPRNRRISTCPDDRPAVWVVDDMEREPARRWLSRPLKCAAMVNAERARLF